MRLKLVMAYGKKINHNLKQKSDRNSFRFTAQKIFVVNSLKNLCRKLKLAWIARFHHNPVTMLWNLGIKMIRRIEYLLCCSLSNQNLRSITNFSRSSNHTFCILLRYSSLFHNKIVLYGFNRCLLGLFLT